MKLKEITSEDRAANDISPEVKGALIVEVAPGSKAAEKGIVAGEIVSKIGQVAVLGPEHVATQVEKLKKEGRKNALLMVSSANGNSRFIVVEM